MPKVDIVIPVYRNAATLPALASSLDRVCRGAGWDFTILFVIDACPQGSEKIAEALAAGHPEIAVYPLERNLGQHRAIWFGLRQAKGDFTFIMDADLQDPPEALPALLPPLAEQGGVVFAGRRGRYESRSRLLSSKVFKTLLHWATGIPKDAGLFLVMDRAARERILQEPLPQPFLQAMIGCLKIPSRSIPVERSRRPEGTSSYRGLDRWKLGIGALLAVGRYRLRKRGTKAGGWKE